MKNLKNLFIFFLIIFSFSFSSIKEKSTVYLEKTNDVSKLKIGVTKLKSEELPLNFNVDTKQIYGEIDINENDVVYVSETLAEMPSISTTNGRRAINNIERYLSREIKKAPNFEWKIINDEKNKKKYLVIDCKTELKNVYIYVVERNNYKVKKVYKGTFMQLFSPTTSEIYGNISIEPEIIDNNHRKITMKSGKLFVSKTSSGGGSYETEDTEAKNGVKLTGKFPERVLFDEIKKVSGRKDPRILVSITSMHGKGEADIKLTKSNDGYSDFKAVFNLQDSTKQHSAQVHIISGDYYNNEGFISIFIKRPRPFEDDEYTVELKYGYYNLSKFYEVINHKFTVNIKGDGEQTLPQNTEGKIIFDRPEPFLTNENTIIGGSLSNNLPEISNQYISKEEYRGNGDFLKKPLREQLNINEIQDGVDLHMILNTSSIEGLDKISRKKITLKEDKNAKWNGKISDQEFNFRLFDMIGKEIGKIGLYSDIEMEDYYKIKISNWDSSFTHQLVKADLTLVYEKVANRGTKQEMRKAIKKDTYSIIINPKKENIPYNTKGTLIITNPSELSGHDIYIDKLGEVGIRKNDKHGIGAGTFQKEQLIWTGELPKKFITDGKNDFWLNWGENSRLIIRGDNGFGEIKTRDKNNKTEPYDYNTGVFWSVGNGGWNRLKTSKGNEVGWIYFSSTDTDKDSETLVIGFCGGSLDPLPGNYQINVTESTGNVNYRFEFVYQIQVGKEWVDKKVDVLDLIIQPNLPTSNPVIELKNPLVYYDYNASTGISNINHNRRVHLAKNEAITLNNVGSHFTKNINLFGEGWITPSSEIRDYPWEMLGKHKISINRGTNEVLKITKENGGTNSSTYLSGNSQGKINKDKNEVMFSYDGGNKYLNFGLSKYNFDGETINDIVITNYSDKSLESRVTYTVKIPKFEGIHYMGNYDIKPKQSYTKDYEYDSRIAYDKEVIIDYGIVGFRNLDTRITNQSDGEGIDFRATRKVKLVSEKNPNYVIKNVELYFEKEKEFPSDDNNETSRFKGENEKATSAMLKLKIPRQETLIPQGRFIILTDNGTTDIDNNPLRIGVTVDNDKKSYYTYIDDENSGANGKNLYLNLTTKRFIETIIEFENPNLKANNQEKNWIKLNKSNYSMGELTKDIEGSNLWGRVEGDVIDIPVKEIGGTNRTLKMTLFDENNNVLIENLNTLNGEKKFPLTSNSNTTPRNFIISRENINDNFIRFTLDNGYDDTPNKEKDIKFYIRYIDISTGTDKFLFDQRYIVKFKKKVNYKGDINIRFKNPSMTRKATGDIGIINLFSRKYSNNGNHNTSQDSIDWVNIGITQRIIDEIKKDLVNSNYTLNDIKNPSNFITSKNLITKLDNIDFCIGLPENKTDFENIFGAFNGEKIEKSFELKFNNDNNKSYRINISIDKFDPKYYGKVFVGNIDSNKSTYEEINNVGSGSIDLQHSNLQSDNFVYVDLGTSYRDYLRYEALPKSLLNKDLFINIKGQVDIIPIESNHKPLKGEVVLFDGVNYIEITDTKKKLIEFTKDGKSSVKEFPLKLKLSLSEYQKLRPYVKYEIYLNGEQNIITIGTESLNDNILFNKPLSFDTRGPGIEIIAPALDFGKINLEKETGTLIIKQGKTETPIEVRIGGILDTNLGLTNSSLEVDTDTIFIKQRNINNEIIKNGGELKVRDLKTEKVQANVNQTTIEYYDLHGVLEIPKNLPRENYGNYSGNVTVTYTFY